MHFHPLGSPMSRHPRMLSLPLMLCSILPTFSCVEGNSGTWATLPMHVVPHLSEMSYVPSTAPVLVGTPPQEMNLTIDVSSGFLATYGSDCILCAGETMFDPSLSSTFKTNNTPWGPVPSFSGVKVSDTVGFGGLFSATDQPFVNILDGSNITYATSVWNGHLGLFLNPLNTTASAQHIFSLLHKSSSLLNPVVGMRFDPLNPKLTIGALDPNDYEGTINWVQLDQTPDPNGDYFNIFDFDGVKGYDNQFVPFPGSLTAALDSFSMSISLPDAETYFNNTDSTGPIPTPIGLITDSKLFEYNCTSNTSTSTSSSVPPQSPYVALTATINGVDYPIDSTGNLLRPNSPVSSIGYCPVGIKNRTDTAQPNILLGLPFLRSVYVAYRFPTDDCPGYYGFAFPSGSNRTQSQIAQTPTATPTNSAQCLSLAAPTSTPTASVALAQEVLASKAMFAVYGRQGASEVPLVGVDDIPQTVWNWTAVTSG